MLPLQPLQLHVRVPLVPLAPLVCGMMRMRMTNSVCCQAVHLDRARKSLLALASQSAAAKVRMVHGRETRDCSVSATDPPKLVGSVCNVSM